MKKTVSVNIKGMNFLIEEDAYELLQDYMNRLSHGLRNEKGSKEIIEDIELRIAELCSTKLTDRKQVIEIEDIESILVTLGDPSQYIEDDSESTETFTSTERESSSSRSSEKRLFRDLDNAAIAGVCSGIANFLNIDVVIVRAIFVIVFMFAGFGLPLYVILWIIVPKANTTIDKLRMRGKAITVDSVKEEVESAAQRLTKESKGFANRIRTDEHYNRRFTSIGRLIAVFLGSGMILMGLFFLVMFIIFGISGLQFIPVQSDTGFLSFPEFGELVLTTESDVNWAWIGVLMAGFSGILFILLLGANLVFRIRNRWSKMSLGLLFFSGFIGTVICIFIGVKTSREMTIEGEIEREIGAVNTEQLVITAHESTLKQRSEYHVKSNGRFGMLGLQGDNIHESGIHFEYRLSKDSLFHVYQNLTAHSHSHKEALKKAENIKHSISLDSSNLHVNTYYTYPKLDKLRDQEVYIIIEIPKDKSIKINNQIIKLGSEEFEERIIDEYYKEDGYLENDGEYDHWN
jgi:phage shock protein PspC (stress-responsive transcriptional regulator)